MSVLVELTRRCNLKCDHCLRGNAQRKDMSDDLIYATTRFINNADSFWYVGFGGGETFLVLDKLRLFLLYLDRKDTVIELITNGTFFRRNKMEETYLPLHDGDFIYISDDQFHRQARSRYQEDRLYEFEFYYSNLVPVTRKGRYIDYNNIIAQGRAKNWGTVTPKTTSAASLFYGDLYIDYQGNLIQGCNWSYAEQKNHIIGNIFDNSINEFNGFNND